MSYYVLDTDHLSILQRQEEPAFTHLTQRLGKHSPTDIFATLRIEDWTI